MPHPSGVGGAAQFLCKLFLGHKSCCTTQVWVVWPNSCLNYFLGINHAHTSGVGGAAQFLCKLFLGHKSCTRFRCKWCSTQFLSKLYVGHKSCCPTSAICKNLSC